MIALWWDCGGMWWGMIMLGFGGIMVDFIITVGCGIQADDVGIMVGCYQLWWDL